MTYRERLMRLTNWVAEWVVDTRDALGDSDCLPADVLVAALDELLERLEDETRELANERHGPRARTRKPKPRYEGD